MQDKIRLLMEETDCEQGEAELALELAGNDLEQAIKTIGSLLRNIFALKGRFFFSQKSLYGLVLVVINTRTREIYRLRTVVSYNPALYEHLPEMDWFTFEKRIFTYRLDEGSLPDFTQPFEERLGRFLHEHQDAFMPFDKGAVNAAFEKFFEAEGGTITLSAEELNLTQFRQLPGGAAPASNPAAAHEADAGTVQLDVALEPDENGREIGHLSEGDVIITRITDTRDIAHYLAHLVGAKKEGEMVPLPTSIKKIAVSGETAEVQVYFAPHIVGVARVAPDARVKTVAHRLPSWWKKILPF